MPQYLLSVYQPDTDEPPSAEFLAPIRRDLDTLNAEMKDAGAWVFAAGLFPAGTATVLRHKGDDILTTDGPYVEGKEHLGGFTIVEAPDLDAALAWGRALARATTLPIEVRPLRYGPSE
ncbi:YciI family protein [Streptomyces sp. NPDC088197]|uniref:YciI family protein n=1 Tax=unclassified Streptomyces TaxID=2593676 RepID=UPI00380D6798